MLSLRHRLSVAPKDGLRRNPWSLAPEGETNDRLNTTRRRYPQEVTLQALAVHILRRFKPICICASSFDTIATEPPSLAGYFLARRAVDEIDPGMEVVALQVQRNAARSGPICT